MPYTLFTFSGYKTLKVVFATLLSLAVTSCSAGRAMGRLKITKDRLRSTMGYTWLSNLMVTGMSAEKDVLESISTEEIIDAFALSTLQRNKLLVRT